MKKFTAFQILSIYC